MATCGYCKSVIIFGGKRDGEFVFCNDRCHEKGRDFLRVLSRLSKGKVATYTRQVYSGPCPSCDGPGPVDVHTKFWVWSIIFMTSWGSNPEICCRSCGVKNQIFAIIGNFIFGWWGFPWGLLLTPIQSIRNIIGIFSPPPPSRPSKKLTHLLRLDLAQQVLGEANQQSA